MIALPVLPALLLAAFAIAWPGGVHILLSGGKAGPKLFFAHAAGEQKDNGNKNHDRPDTRGIAMPWEMPYSWVPPYHGLHNDASALISAQRHPSLHWVSLFSMYGPYSASGEALDVLLNAITSYVILGQSRHYIVAATSQPALQACLRLRLPCWNATAAIAPALAAFQRPGDSRAGYFSACWAKTLATYHLLLADPDRTHVHYSDADVVYLKPVLPAIAAFFALSSDAADVSMMREEASFTALVHSSAHAFLNRSGSSSGSSSGRAAADVRGGGGGGRGGSTPGVSTSGGDGRDGGGITSRRRLLANEPFASSSSSASTAAAASSVTTVTGQYHFLMNAGVTFVRNNARSRAMYAAWTTQIAPDLQDWQVC